jgi:peptidoglycan-N-acetylglucosamine deacetylase
MVDAPHSVNMEIADDEQKGADAMKSPRATACFTFDNMAEAAEVGSGRLEGPGPHGSDPSLAAGFPRLYDLLATHQIRATFFIEGWNGLHHPDAVAAVVARGHELGMHGWVHEGWAGLDADDERARAERATEALTRASGVRPIGFRAPGGSRSAASEGILRDLGYRYDASLGDGMRPQRLPSGLVQVPFVWPGVDGYYYLRPDPVPAATVRDCWLARLAETAAAGGLFLVVCHAFISGVDDERLAVLDAVMAAAVRDHRVTIRTAAEVAADVE